MKVFKKGSKIEPLNPFKELISDPEYKLFLNSCLNILEDLEYKITSYNDSIIVYTSSKNKDGYFTLENLLKNYIKAEDKEREIQLHFTKLRDHSDAYTYLYKDFDYAQQYLKLILKNSETIPNKEIFVFQENLPDLLTMLVFDFQDQLYFIERTKIEEWDIKDFVLFEIALNNITKENVEIKEFTIEHKQSFFGIFHEDYGASYLLNIQSILSRLNLLNHDISGCLTAIPARGAALIYPLKTDHDVQYIYHYSEDFLNNIFHQEPNPITLSFYWYHNQTFRKCESRSNEMGEIYLSLPLEYHELITSK